ncbi:MAG: OsmC family protein [Dehalococcoidia bacterium]
MASITTADLQLVEHMRFAAHTGSGHQFEIDTKVESGGDDTAASPVEHVLAAVGACMAMDAVSILRKMRQDIAAYSVHLEAPRTEQHPRVFTAITMTHTLRGQGIDPANVARALQLSLTRYCPVHAMLHASVPFTVRYDVTDVTDGARTTGEVRSGQQPPAGAP